MNKIFRFLGEKAIPFNYFRGEGINNKTFPQEFFMIVGLFAKDCRYKLCKCYCHYNRLFIEGRYNGRPCELMLRIRPGHDFGLVIARVQFIHQRKGNLTKLIEILEDIRKANSLGDIMIENVSTPEMKSWIKKNGWIALNRWSGNYISKEGIKRKYKKLGIKWNGSTMGA